MLVDGMTYSQKKTVKENELASSVGSGGMEVFSTPMMIAFMENTAFKLAEGELEEGQTTVGISVNIRHMRPNLVGDQVECRAELVKAEGKKLHYVVEVSYKDEVIGTGDHVRYIVDEKKFIENIKR